MAADHKGLFAHSVTRVCWTADGNVVGWFDVVPGAHTTEEMDDVTATLAPTSRLTAADRCDRCGAQAYVRVRLTSGGELLFCAHHARRYESQLRAMEAEIFDETERLTGIPSTSPPDEQ